MYIIGDVHGCYDTLLALVDKIKAHADTPNPPIAFVGDLIDRGPKSKQVIQYVIDNNHLCVKGNHEDMFATRNFSSEHRATFLSNGGNTTLASYTSPSEDFLLLDHTLWADRLPLFLELPEYTLDNRTLVISHSSIARAWPKIDTTPAHRLEEHILWNRDVYHGTLPSSNTIYNVFGHSPVENAFITNFCANLDTGCVYNNKRYNKLTAFHFPSLEIIEQHNIEKDQQ